MSQSETFFDVLTLGETMLRFTPPGRVRLEQAHQLQVHIGGSESNTAVGLVRLGLRTAWISRLPNSALGRMVSGELARYGVNVDHVVWSDIDRLGLYFLEEAGPPRGSQVIYDRAQSAISRITPNQLPMVLFQRNAFRLFHTTGITLALSESARATAMHAANLAKQNGGLVSFDVNYRSKLWNAVDAARHCEPMFEIADVVFIPDRDARTLLGLNSIDEPEQSLEQLAKRWPHATWVMTRGRLGSSALSRGTLFMEGIFASDEVGRLGGGDAFSAGFLAHYLESQGDVESSLRWGAATSALKYSIPGDLPLVTRAEVAALVGGGSAESLRR